MSGSGAVLVVGAPPMLTDRGAAGRVYVCAHVSSGWQVQSILHPSFGASPESFWGGAVAISTDGSTIAVGDEFHSVPGLNVGSAGLVDVFRHVAGHWQLSSELSSPQPQYLGEFGASLALSAGGDRIVVGSPWQLVAHPAHTIDYDGGAAWIFTVRSDGTQWDSASLPLPSPSAGYADNFGTAVALSADGDTAAVGSLTTGAAVQHNGHVFVYDTTAATPVATTTLLPTHDLRYWGFGETLAMSSDGSTIVAAAPDDPSQGAEVFDRHSGSWTRTATILPQGTAVAARFGQALAVSADGNTVIVTAPMRSVDGGTVSDVGGGYRYVHDSVGWHWGGELAPNTPTADQEVGWSAAMSADARYALLGAPTPTGGGHSELFLQQDP